MVHFTSAFYTREEISPFARIIAIADTYYELVSVRPDRPAYMPHEVLATSESGTLS